MADKLSIYNGALFELKETRIKTLSDARSSRRALDAVWDGTLKYMLAQGLWMFASRQEELQSSDTAVPQFGMQYAFEKPDDYVNLLDISDNERFDGLFTEYEFDGDYFYCDTDPIYVDYVSDDYAYGADPGKWGASFARAFELEFAIRAGPSISSLTLSEKQELRAEAKKELRNAKAKDARAKPIEALPRGRLVRARSGYRSIYNAQRKAGYIG